MLEHGRIRRMGGRLSAGEAPACCRRAWALLPRLQPRLSSGLWPGPKVDSQREDPVDQFRFGVPDHGEIGEVTLRLLPEPLSFGTLDRRHSPCPYRFRSLSEPVHQRLRVELGRHARQRRW